MERHLHLCWLIDAWAESREKYLRAWLKAGWHVVLWHGDQPPFDSALASAPVAGVELRSAEELIAGSPIEPAYRYEQRHKNHAACADLFRYHVLYELGGAYADIDVWPGQSAHPAVCEAPNPFFGRVWVPLQWIIEIRFISTPAPQHPLLERLREKAVKNSKTFMAAGGHAVITDLNLVQDRTGPRMAKSVIQQYARDSESKLSRFVLKRATRDNTEENNSEHFTLKETIVREIASTNL